MITGDPQWYIDAVIYQLHIKAFFDSNDDGIGDIKGLERKLDYLQELGVTALWLLPFYPSPLKDDGYDIADYYRINPQYGTMRDFRSFLKSAHARGMRVITELVINHTSDQHPWFQRSRKARPGTSWRNFYVWRDTPKEFSDARIIFTDFESSNWTWDPEAGAYYWHRFYSHQPDLNFDNPRVKKEILKVLDFWFAMGVDGLRLDAVPYLFEREGTNCENLPETHSFLKELREHVESTFREKMLLAEANQWPEDAVSYFGDGDECHMAFNFPIMPRIFMSMRMEDRFPLIDMVEQTPSIPEKCQWAIFLRNHDELTLEMVSDEERDYMYRVYARDTRARINLGIRRRLAPLLEKNRRKLELINFLLLCLPGTPIVYYGDEIGMGDNYFLGDRDGVRTPMQWSPDRNAGFSKANPQQLYLPVIFNHDYHYETINVENNEKNPSSLLWWMRRIISMRKQYKAFSRGDIKFIDTNNSKILAFTRKYKDEVILVIINLSRYSQQAELDLAEYAGYIPTEIFSRNDFQQIDEHPYMFPLQFKNYFWFELRKPEEGETAEALLLDYELSLTTRQWNSMSETTQKSLRLLLKEYIQKNRWFRGKAKRIKDIKIIDTIPFQNTKLHSFLFIIETDYIEGKNEHYVVPLSINFGDEAHDLRTNRPESAISTVFIDGKEALLYDGSYNKEVRDMIMRMIVHRSKIRHKRGELVGIPGRKMNTKIKKSELPLPSKVLGAEQSNTSILYDNRFFFKMYRGPEEGNNPELEIIKALTENETSAFTNYPKFSGALEYRPQQGSPVSLGILVDFVPNEGNAWEFTQDAVERYFEHITSKRQQLMEGLNEEADILGQIGEEKHHELFEDFFLEMIELLGKRTAEMHLALGGIKNNKDFKEEPFSLLYQKSLYQSFRTLVKRTVSEMKKARPKLADEQKTLIDDIIKNE